MRIPKTLILKAVRAKCLDCVGDQHKEISLCPSKKCPLWLYRFGGASVKKVPELQVLIESMPKVNFSKIYDPIEKAIKEAKCST